MTSDTRAALVSFLQKPKTHQLQLTNESNCYTSLKPDDSIHCIDAFRKIVSKDGVRGLYRGVIPSLLTYIPGNAIWWASYGFAKAQGFSLVHSILDSGQELSFPQEVMVQVPAAVIASTYPSFLAIFISTLSSSFNQLFFFHLHQGVCDGNTANGRGEDANADRSP